MQFVSRHYSTACVMLRFYSWMKVASLHHDYMCLVTVHSRNFTVWWCKWIPCGSSRGVEILSLGKVSRGESHPGWTLPVRGFSNNLLQLSSGENSEENGLHNCSSLMPRSTVLLQCSVNMVEKCCHVKVVTPLWLHKNKGIWGGQGLHPGHCFVELNVSWKS